MFLAFAFGYFFSALLRAVMATLAPVFSTELGLQAADLGLLAGAYFLGFAALQLPLGRALDRWGPRRTLLSLTALAVLGCAAFAMAEGLPSLVAARVLIGAGLSAGLMAPLTCFRLVFAPATQLRANAWMLMTGSLGMLASTLPVQALLPGLGWRGLFWVLAALLLLTMVGVAWIVPRDPSRAVDGAVREGGYGVIVRTPIFRRMAPLAFVLYGGLIAVQSLWAGPWLTRVCGWSAQAAAQGLFLINSCMLLTFMLWGWVMPRLVRQGVTAARLMAWGVPLPLAILSLILWLGSAATAWVWALWCVSCTVVSASQPAVGAAFATHQAGRALSAFNLVIFGGVFCVQWGLGVLIDGLRQQGVSESVAFRAAFAVLWVASAAAYLDFLRRRPQAADNAG